MLEPSCLWTGEPKVTIKVTMRDNAAEQPARLSAAGALVSGATYARKGSLTPDERCVL